jgi:hypothetical protein
MVTQPRPEDYDILLVSVQAEEGNTISRPSFEFMKMPPTAYYDSSILFIFYLWFV